MEHAEAALAAEAEPSDLCPQEFNTVLPCCQEVTFSWPLVKRPCRGPE